MTLEASKKRQLEFSDLVPGKEFTLAQTSSATQNNGEGSKFRLRVGDVIKIHSADEKGMRFSVNGRFVSNNYLLFVPVDEIGDFTIIDEE